MENVVQDIRDQLASVTLDRGQAAVMADLQKKFVEDMERAAKSAMGLLDHIAPGNENAFVDLMSAGILPPLLRIAIVIQGSMTPGFSRHAEALQEDVCSKISREALLMTVLRLVDWAERALGRIVLNPDPDTQMLQGMENALRMYDDAITLMDGKASDQFVLDRKRLSNAIEAIRAEGECSSP